MESIQSLIPAGGLQTSAINALGAQTEIAIWHLLQDRLCTLLKWSEY